MNKYIIILIGLIVVNSNFYISEKDLKKLYINKKKSILALSKEFNIKQNQIYKYIIKYKLKKKWKIKEYNCSWCNKLFKNSYITKNNLHFCSRKCKNNYYQEKRKRICVICGNEYKSQYAHSITKVCGKECEKELWNIYKKEKYIKIKCKICNKEFYKKPYLYIKQKNHFCSLKCANKYQGRNKVKFICKICNKESYISKSFMKQKGYKKKYCSINCRNKDIDWYQNSIIKGNIVQQRKKGLNKLELEGRKILKNIGLKRNKDFKEQVLMFKKFLVDIVIESKKLIIQWDGVYWHSKPKRKKLDYSQDQYMKKCGYSVLRITDEQIKNNKGEVIEIIKNSIRKIV